MNPKPVFSLIAATALLSAALSAQAQSTKSITFWVRAADQGFVDPLVKAYNAKGGTQVKLTVIPQDDFVTKFGTAVAGGNPPDVVAVDLVFMPAFAKSGQMTDMTAYYKGLPFAKSLSPSHIRLATFDNKVYGVPFSAESSVLIYNKDLFTKAGLDPNKPPKTWAEIEAAAKKIKALGDGNYGYYFSGSCAGCNIFTFAPMIWAAGGDILNAQGTAATVDTPAVRAALGFYKRLWDQKLMPPGAKTDNGANFFSAFATGKIGMVGSGAFAIGNLKKSYPNLKFGLAPLPGQTGGVSSFAGGDLIAIPVGSKNVQAAQEFISWCLSADVQVQQFAKNGSIPVRSDLASNEYSKLDTRYVLVSKLMDKGRTPYTLRYNELINDANGPWLAMIQDSVFGGDVDAAVKKAQARFMQILGGK